jgi:GNAT superfamily N-acetyltransferase
LSFRVRQLRSAEFERWRDLRLRALRDSPNAFGTRYDDELGRPLSSWRERARDLAAGGARVMFVVDTGEEHLAGCAGAYTEADGTPRVISMWVAPEIRMQGAGGDLLRNLADWARQRDASRLTLMVVRGNSPATALYETFGFRPTGVTERNLQNQLEDEMALDLSK